MERGMVQARDKRAIDGAMSAASIESGSSRRSDGWCEQCTGEQ